MQIKNNKFYRIFITGTADINNQNFNIQFNDNEFNIGRSAYCVVEHFYMGETNGGYVAPLYIYTDMFQTKTYDSSSLSQSQHLLTIQNLNNTYYYNMDNNDNGILTILPPSIRVFLKIDGVTPENMLPLVGPYKLILRFYLYE